ncbi:hypothetical protein FJTKL_02651 [Diaporthe vaccinii]|uniref:Uncharacterized protein n=1 Tax=Diaporthe vaccinii TaxID=105482 RepID=A0ABR4DXM5_9PEZI
MSLLIQVIWLVWAGLRSSRRQGSKVDRIRSVVGFGRCHRGWPVLFLDLGRQSLLGMISVGPSQVNVVMMLRAARPTVSQMGQVWDMPGEEGRWKRGQKKAIPSGMMEATLVFIKGAGAGMVQEHSGSDKEM